MSNRWEHEGVARRARQWPTLERLIQRVEVSPALAGMILVECLLTTVSSGVRLADPAVVVAGDPGLLDRFPRRPPITRAEMRAHPLELHPVEWTYDELKAAARAALNMA